MSSTVAQRVATASARRRPLAASAPMAATCSTAVRRSKMACARKRRRAEAVPMAVTRSTAAQLSKTGHAKKHRRVAAVRTAATRSTVVRWSRACARKKPREARAPTAAIPRTARAARPGTDRRRLRWPTCRRRHLHRRIEAKGEAREQQPGQPEASRQPHGGTRGGGVLRGAMHATEERHGPSVGWRATLVGLRVSDRS